MGGIRGSKKGEKPLCICEYGKTVSNDHQCDAHSLWLLLSIIFDSAGLFNISLYDEKYIAIANPYTVLCICPMCFRIAVYGY